MSNLQNDHSPRVKLTFGDAKTDLTGLRSSAQCK
jgi:hypothetical protein